MWLTLLMQVTCLAVKHLCPVLYCSCFLLLIFVSAGATHIKTKLATFAAIQASSSPSHRPPPSPPPSFPTFAMPYPTCAAIQDPCTCMAIRSLSLWAPVETYMSILKCQ